MVMWAPTYQRPDSLIKRGRESWNFAALAATMLFGWRLQQSECRRTRNKNHTRETVRNPEDRALPSMGSYSSHPSIAFSLFLRPQWRSSCSQEYLCLCDGVAAQLRNWHQPMPSDFFYYCNCQLDSEPERSRHFCIRRIHNEAGCRKSHGYLKVAFRGFCPRTDFSGLLVACQSLSGGASVSKVAVYGILALACFGYVRDRCAQD